MKTVYHPTFDYVSYDVPDASAKEWLKAGWLNSPLKPSGKPVDETPTNENTPEGTPA